MLIGKDSGLNMLEITRGHLFFQHLHDQLHQQEGTIHILQRYVLCSDDKNFVLLVSTMQQFMVWRVPSREIGAGGVADFPDLGGGFVPFET